jgi:8-oxo-dGTP pyrophosphatase MutT (NUDIX family)
MLPGDSTPAGETFHQAATRGLQEELGITAVVPQQPLGPVHKRSLVVPGLYTDNELVQSYRVDGFEGQVCWDSNKAQQGQQMYSVVWVSSAVHCSCQHTLLLHGARHSGCAASSPML